MINKNQFNIRNTKKVLHKVGKQWLVVSAVTLGLLAGGAALSSTQHVALPQSLTTEAHAGIVDSSSKATPQNQTLLSSTDTSAIKPKVNGTQSSKPITVNYNHLAGGNGNGADESAANQPELKASTTYTVGAGNKVSTVTGTGNSAKTVIEPGTLTTDPTDEPDTQGKEFLPVFSGSFKTADNTGRNADYSKLGVDYSQPEMYTVNFNYQDVNNHNKSVGLGEVQLQKNSNNIKYSLENDSTKAVESFPEFYHLKTSPFNFYQNDVLGTTPTSNVYTVNVPVVLNSETTQSTDNYVAFTDGTNTQEVHVPGNYGTTLTNEQLWDMFNADSGTETTTNKLGNNFTGDTLASNQPFLDNVDGKTQATEMMLDGSHTKDLPYTLLVQPAALTNIPCTGFVNGTFYVNNPVVKEVPATANMPFHYTESVTIPARYTSEYSFDPNNQPQGVAVSKTKSDNDTATFTLTHGMTAPTLVLKPNVKATPTYVGSTSNPGATTSVSYDKTNHNFTETATMPRGSQYYFAPTANQQQGITVSSDGTTASFPLNSNTTAPTLVDGVVPKFSASPSTTVAVPGYTTTVTKTGSNYTETVMLPTTLPTALKGYSFDDTQHQPSGVTVSNNKASFNPKTQYTLNLGYSASITFKEGSNNLGGGKSYSDVQGTPNESLTVPTYYQLPDKSTTAHVQLSATNNNQAVQVVPVPVTPKFSGATTSVPGLSTPTVNSSNVETVTLPSESDYKFAAQGQPSGVTVKNDSTATFNWSADMQAPTLKLASNTQTKTFTFTVNYTYDNTVNDFEAPATKQVTLTKKGNASQWSVQNGGSNTVTVNTPSVPGYTYNKSSVSNTFNLKNPQDATVKVNYTKSPATKYNGSVKFMDGTTQVGTLVPFPGLDVSKTTPETVNVPNGFLANGKTTASVELSANNANQEVAVKPKVNPTTYNETVTFNDETGHQVGSTQSFTVPTSTAVKVNVPNGYEFNDGTKTSTVTFTNGTEDLVLQVKKVPAQKPVTPSNPNVTSLNGTVKFMSGKKQVAITTFTVPSNYNGTMNVAVPAGYEFFNGAKNSTVTFTPGNENLVLQVKQVPTTSASTKPSTYNATVNFMDGTKNVGSETFTGLSGNQTETVTTAPKGYELANNAARTTVPFTSTNKTATVSVQPVPKQKSTPPATALTASVTFKNGDQTVATQSVGLSGNGSTTKNVTVPNGYELFGGATTSSVTFNKANENVVLDVKPVPQAPSKYTGTVNFVESGKSEPVATTTVSNLDGTSTDTVTAPNGYQLAKNQKNSVTFNANDKTQTVYVTAVAPKTVNVPGKTTTKYVNVPGKTTTKYVNVPGKTVTKYVNVPGPTKYVNVPGKTVTKDVNVPGQTKYVTKNVPGPVKYVTKNVAGPTQYVNVPGATQYVNVPGQTKVIYEPAPTKTPANKSYVVVPDNNYAVKPNHSANFYVNGKAKMTAAKAVKNGTVLSAYYKGNQVMYTVKVGKLVGHVYGRAKAPKLALKKGNVVAALRKGNLVKYTVKVGKRTHNVYKTLTNKVAGKTSSRYHMAFPKVSKSTPVYVQLTHYAWYHNSKHFTKSSFVKKLSKGTMIKVVKLVKAGHTTRFLCSNGMYVTGLKSFIKY